MSQIEDQQGLTVRDIILTTQKYVKFLLRKWYLVALVAIGFGLYQAYSYHMMPVNYKAVRKFYMERSGGGGGGGGGISGLLGAVGIGKDGNLNPEKVIEIANSNVVVIDLILSKYGPDDEYVGNMILEAYDYREEWAEDNPNWLNFRFQHADLTKFTSLENAALKRLINIITTSNVAPMLRWVFHDEDANYYQVTINTASSILSEAIDEVSFQQIKNYFENKELKGFLDHREILEYKSDSLRVLLEGKIYELGRFQDQNRNNISSQSTIRTKLLEGQIGGISQAYQEILRNFELADYQVRSRTPVFLVIDKPLYPLGYSKPIWYIGFLKGFIIGLVIGIVLVIILRVYLDTVDIIKSEMNA